MFNGTSVSGTRVRLPKVITAGDYVLPGCSTTIRNYFVLPMIVLLTPGSFVIQMYI